MIRIVECKFSNIINNVCDLASGSAEQHSDGLLALGHLTATFCFMNTFAYTVSIFLAHLQAVFVFKSA